MRTLRLTLAGAAILALLGGLGSAVVAQEETTAPEVPVWITGTMPTEDIQSFGSRRMEGGIVYDEGSWWKIAWEASDPRLSGEGTWSANWHETGSGQVGITANTYVLDGPNGRWVGTGQGFMSAGGTHVMVNLSGESGYDGLTATVLVHTDFTSVDPPTLVGVITPVEPPEFPETVEPPAE